MQERLMELNQNKKKAKNQLILLKAVSTTYLDWFSLKETKKSVGQKL